ncbi:MAG TPA: PaaI family thioesterase [Methylomirabilota bacterium]|nr:PaaI family thioesterase [Methylomirabilota bacterium]
MTHERPDPGVGPFGDLLQTRRTLMADGRSRFELVVGPRHLNPYGVVHGGVLYALVDFAMGGALTSRLGPGERCATLEIKINYLAPVSDGPLAAEARVIERTKRVAVLEARVESGGGELVAVATGTFYIQADRS